MRLSIDQFQRVYKVVKSTEDEIDRLTGVCAVIHGGQPEDYLKKTVKELSGYNVDITIPEGKAPVSFWAHGKKYNVNHLVSEITAGEFIDLTEFTKSEDALVENLHNILAIFCKPEKKWFRKAVTDRVKIGAELQKYCGTDVALPTSVFFCTLYKKLQQRIVSYGMVEEMKLLKNQRKAVRELLKDITAGR